MVYWTEVGDTAMRSGNPSLMGFEFILDGERVRHHLLKHFDSSTCD
jgi:hypothetical protein